MRECPTCNFLIGDAVPDCEFCGPVDAEIVEVTTVADFRRGPDHRIDRRAGEVTAEVTADLVTADLVAATSHVVVATERVGHEPAPAGVLEDDGSEPSSAVGAAFPAPYPSPWPREREAEVVPDATASVAARSMRLIITMCLVVGLTLLGVGVVLLSIVV